MSCPICLENNNNNIYFECTHYVCYSCLSRTQNTNIRLNSCPICRRGRSFSYYDIFPRDNYPIRIENWSNPNFHNLKGQYESITNNELDWIKANWGILGSEIDKDNLVQNKMYVILNYNYYLKGKFNCPSRELEDNYIFSNCKIFDRSGKIYDASPSTRSVILKDYNIKVFNLD